jgi:hypothetical protein
MADEKASRVDVSAMGQVDNLRRVVNLACAASPQPAQAGIRHPPPIRSLAVNTLYAGPFHLGEMYMQESFEDGRLLFAAGRLGPNFQFATIPILGNYLNGGFNAQVTNI